MIENNTLSNYQIRIGANNVDVVKEHQMLSKTSWSHERPVEKVKKALAVVYVPLIGYP